MIETSEHTVSYGDVEHMTSIPFDQPTFCLPRKSGPVRVLGLVVCYGRAFKHNGEPFECFPVTESGAILFDQECRWSGAMLFHNPVKKGTKFYEDMLQASIDAREVSSEEEFLLDCEDLGIEFLEDEAE